jgi:hypothetical protein
VPPTDAIKHGTGRDERDVWTIHKLVYELEDDEVRGVIREGPPTREAQR